VAAWWGLAEIVVVVGLRLGVATGVLFLFVALWNLVGMCSCGLGLLQLSDDHGHGVSQAAGVLVAVVTTAA